MTQLLEDLKAASERLAADRSRWAKGAFWLGLKGRDVLSRQDTVCSMCALGAVLCALPTVDPATLYRAGFEEETGRYDLANIALTEAVQELYGVGYSGIATFNDDPDTTYEQVLEVFDRAIVNEEKKA